MKKLLLLLLFIPLTFACSDDSDSDDATDLNDGQPSQIKFTLEEVWQDKLTFSISNNRQVNCGDDYIAILGGQGATEYYYGLAGNGPIQRNHYSLDTLVLDLTVATIGYPYTNKGFNLGPLNPAETEALVNPKYIGHIEFIGFDEESKIFLTVGRLENYFSGVKKMEYFTSNVSDDYLNSISYDSYPNSDCPGGYEGSFNFFVKSEEDYNNLKFREHFLPYNLTNDNFEIGVLLGIDNDAIMEGIGNAFNYTIVDKEYIY